MKSILLITIILLTFSSCAVINSLLGINNCAREGCNRQALDNCNYCGFHCESYSVPSDFNEKVGKSIDEQIEKSRRQTPVNNK